jgi:DNA-directed RNA polymerase I, II, and III subunit RPABC2
MIRLYNVLRKIPYLSEAPETEVMEITEEEIPTNEENPITEEIIDAEVETNAGLTKALDTYRTIDRKRTG